MIPLSVTGQRIVRLDRGWQLALTAPGAATEPKALAESLDWIDAVVPGTAAQTLQAAGRWRLEQPEPLHDKDIWYRTTLNDKGQRTLRFAGLATCAEVWLNNSRILDSTNMFLTHEVDVDLTGNDRLCIAFRSLDKVIETRKGRARWRTKLVENNALRQVRTTLLGHMTGWQPAVHAVGPWRPVSLIEQAASLRIRSVDLRTRLDGEDGILDLALEIDDRGRPAASVEVGAVGAPLSWTDDGHLTGQIRLPRVEKWWPRTHGTPALHQVTVRIGDSRIDLGRTGFRSITVDRGTDGKGFTLVVNGVKIFARGACWSASDLVSLAGDRASLLPWLEQAADANMNMVRVGGTMTYESDDFFALCDELGLLVWHDFMFANMDYPAGDEAFRATVEAEVAQFLRRTRQRPSLAVLCGGSEVAQQVAMMGLPPELWTGPLYEDLLPREVAVLRPDVPYVAHSPGGGNLPFSTDVGISHYYGVGAYRRPLEDARRANVRFTSECLGFANVPAAASPGVPWTDATRWKDAVPRDRGTDWDFEDVRDHYLRLLYGVDPKELRAKDWPHYLRLSRAVSAEVMGATIAEWRRPGSSCAGALIWMLKDFVPGAGWGVVDANNLAKLAWHGLRRAFQPVRAAVTDEGLNGLGIHLLNDSPGRVTARLSLTCLHDGAMITLKRERDVELPGQSGRTVSSAELIGSFFDITYAYRFGPPPLDAAVVRLSTPDTGTILDESVFYPLGRAALGHSSGLTAEPVRDGDGWILSLRAQKLAPMVQIEDANYAALEEGFVLMPGEERGVPLRAISTAQAKPTGAVFSGAGIDLIRY